MSHTIDLNQQLSTHFSLREFVVSGTALRHHIENLPAPQQVERLRDLCQQVLEPLRLRFGVIRITSGYRCELLNELVGGVPASQHLTGEAADLHISNMEVGQKMFCFIRDHTSFDQLLFERVRKSGVCWLHVSHRRGHNRHDARQLRV